jgi:hypothetical protein
MARHAGAQVLMRRTMALAGIASLTALLGLATQPAPAAASPALLGQWRFDEPDGQLAVDDGPHRLDGRLGQTAGAEAADPVRIQGASGRALAFDGGDSVSLPAADALAVQTLSAETVVRAPTSPGQFRYLVSRGSHGCIAGSYGLYTAAAGGVALYVFDGTRYVVSASARAEDVWNGAWHHVAGTFDGGALRLFVDGQPVGAPMPAPLHIDYAQTSAQSIFGQYAGGCELSFKGDIDLVRLWAGALSPQAVAASVSGSSVPPGASGPLPAAAPGRVIPSGWTTPADPATDNPPARRCVVRLVRATTTAKRRTVVRVRVTVRRRPLRTRVVARHRGRKKVLARARTNASGRARLVLTSGRSRRVRISAQGHRACGAVELRLPRR